MSMVAAGIGAAALASLAMQAGYVLQAMDAREADPDRSPAATLGGLLGKRRWKLGAALIVSGVALQLLALDLAPLTVVQPTLALGVVGLVIVGGRVLGEPPGRGDVVAACAIAAGVTAIALSAQSFEAAPPHIGVAIAVMALFGAPTVAGLLTRRPRPALLVAGAGGGDAVAALAAERLVSNATGGHWGIAAGWAAVAGLATLGSISVEMAALRHWQATRVGPTVLVCQVVLPALVAPVVAGDRWGSATPIVLASLVVIAVAAGWLARAAGRVGP